MTFIAATREETAQRYADAKKRYADLGVDA